MLDPEGLRALAGPERAQAPLDIDFLIPAIDRFLSAPDGGRTIHVGAASLFWSREALTIRWAMPDRAALEAVVRIELPPDHAHRALAEHSGAELDYAVNVWWRHF